MNNVLLRTILSTSILIIFAGCNTALLNDTTECRIVHLKVVVDFSYITTALWKNNITTLIDAASQTYKS